MYVSEQLGAVVDFVEAGTGAAVTSPRGSGLV